MTLAVLDPVLFNVPSWHHIIHTQQHTQNDYFPGGESQKVCPTRSYLPYCVIEAIRGACLVVVYRLQHWEHHHHTLNNR